MNLSISTLFHLLQQQLRDPLLKNSILISFTKFSDVGIGFFFWIIAAKLYSVNEVGIATALISSLLLIIAFSRFGFDISQIRFATNYDKSAIFNTCLWISIILTIFISIAYIFFIDFISPTISFIKNFALIFIIFAIAISIKETTGYAFLAVRRPEYQFFQNSIMAIRLLLLFLFVGLGAIGIWASLGFAYLLSASVALLLIKKFVSVKFEINRKFVKETMHFTFFSYIATHLQNLATLIFPILVLNVLGASAAAQYFIAFAISSLLIIIPDAFSFSFFIEGSHGENVKKNIKKSIIVNYLILIPAIIFILIFGNTLLSFFGPDYTNSTNLLNIFAVSILFFTLYYFFIKYETIRFNIGKIIIVNLIRFISLIVASYILMGYYGIIGIGYAWFVIHVLIAVGILFHYRKNITSI
jgi:O-antigen/teichoic acid export membrane protein